MTAINVPTMLGPNLGLKVRNQSAKTLTPGSVGFIFDTVTYDTWGAYNATTGIVTIPQTGTYRFDLQIDGSAQSAASAQQINITIDVNSTTVASSHSPASQSTNSLIAAQLSTSLVLNAGDQIRIEAFVYPTGNVITNGSNTVDQTFLSVILVSPGAQGPIGPSGGAAPTGSIFAYGAAGPPAGFLMCDGTSYLRTDYPALFGILGTSYGSVDGTHFNVPNLQSKLPAGYNAVDPNYSPIGYAAGGGTHNHPLSTNGYAKIYAALTSASGNFQHSRINVPTWTPNVSNATSLSFGAGSGTTGAATALGGQTDDVAAPVPPYQVVNYIIKT